MSNSHSIVNITGGLGNQMFQYSFGVYLKYVHGLEVLYAVDSYDFIDSHGGLMLESFSGVELRRANVFSINVFRNFLFSKYRIRQLIVKLPVLADLFKVTTDYNIGHSIATNSIKASCYFHGYWQSRFFADQVKLELRDVFSYSSYELLDEYDKVNLSIIDSTNSVALHVRRGDYVTNPRANKFHGVCDLSYYLSALCLIKSKIDNPRFFIFSDDVRWVRENILPLCDNSVIVSRESLDRSHNDLLLMSKCKHQIISNSTFSWWAAYLNGNPERIIIAPERWSLSSEMSFDLLPNDWIKL